MDDETTQLTIIPPAEILPAPVLLSGHEVGMIDADTDGQLIDMWLHGRAPRTRRSYGTDANAFLSFAGKPLRLVNLNDLQAYQSSWLIWRPPANAGGSAP